MTNVNVITNPFDRNAGRLLIPANSGTKISTLIDEYTKEDFDVVVMVNGNQTEDLDYEIETDDIVSIISKVQGGGGGGGKSVLRIVAFIAVSIVSAGVLAGAGGFLGQGALGAFLPSTAGSFGAYAGAMAISVGGAMLINAVLPPPIPEVGHFDFNNREDSNTYGWGQSQNQINEGLTSSVLYGKHKITPQIIGRYRTFSGNKDYMNLLMHISDGQMGSITDIKVNDLPIADLSSETPEVRLGTLNQTVIKKFADTVSEKNVSFELEEEEDEIIVATDGTAVEKLVVGVICPSGLYKFSGGSYTELYTRFTIQYRAVGSGTWLDWSNKDDGTIDSWNVGVSGSTGKVRSVTKLVSNTVTGAYGRKQTTWSYANVPESDSFSTDAYTVYGDSPDTLRFQFEHDTVLAPDQYEVRIVRKKKFQSATGSSAQANRLFVSHIQEIIEDDFIYPERALLSVNAVAQEKIYGSSPVISCVAEREYVYQYAGDWGDGLPTLRDGASPAWACYDMLTHPMYGAGIHPDQIIIQDFIDWHDFCVAKSIECNLYFDQSSSMADSLKQIGVLGLGSVVQRGTKFGAVWDDASAMVHMFNMGNIVEGSLNMAYIEKENRANTVDISYYDKDLDYDRKILTQKLVENDTEFQERKNSINLIGCTGRQQAIDYARFVLRSNKHLIRTVNFTADIDAVPVQVGDVFGLSHDVPLYGESGRVVAGSPTTIILDREVAMETGETYQITVRDSQTDVLETQNILNLGTGTYSTLTIDAGGSWTTEPSKHDIYSFGISDTQVKKFRCTGIEKTQDMQVSISGLEYREEVYVNDPAQLPDYESEANAPELVGLRIDDRYKIHADGTTTGSLSIIWRGYAPFWKVSVVEKDSGFTKDSWNGRTTQTLWDADGIEVLKTYTVRVEGPQGTILEQDYTPELNFPSIPVNLVGSQVDNFVLLDWEEPESDLPIAKYEIRKGTDYATAELIGTADKTFTSFYETTGGEFTYWVNAVTGNFISGDADTVTLTVDSPPDFEALSDPLEIDGTGTSVNMVYDNPYIIGPIGNTETWDDFWSNAYPPDGTGKTWQDFIDEGFEWLWDPSSGEPETASYEQVFDLGAIIGEGSLSLTLNKQELTSNGGGYTVATNMSYSDDGITYTDGGNSLTVRASNFRYVKLEIDVATDGTTVLSFDPEIKVNAKKFTQIGSGTVTVANDGETIPLSGFYDVSSIQVSPKGTVFRVPVYDFDDVPNPTEFTVFLYDENGVKQNGIFSYTVTGI